MIVLTKTIDKVIDEFDLIIYNYGKNLSDNDFNNYRNLCESMKRFKLFLLDQIMHINVIDNFLRDRNRIFEVVDNSNNISTEIIQLLNILDLDNIDVKRYIESIVDKLRDKNYMKRKIIIKIYYEDMNNEHDDFCQAITSKVL